MTLSTLVRNKSRMKWSLYWAAITAFCIIFAFIYEIFSHGVYSNAMIFMFAYPLLLGAVPCLILAKMGLEMPNRFYQDGVLTMTLASLLSGILEIYGTSSDYTGWFFYAGIALTVIGAVLMFLKPKQSGSNHR